MRVAKEAVTVATEVTTKNSLFGKVEVEGVVDVAGCVWLRWLS